MLEVKDLSLQFLDGNKVLKNINFSIKEKSINLLTGKSGCGKSSLLMCLSRVIPQTIEGYIDGQIIFKNENIENKKTQDIAGEIAYMFQDSDSQLCTFTVEDEIAFGLENLNISTDKMEDIIDETLNLVGIRDLKKRNLNKLSGGEKQKVALASILALNPTLILMDEPTANLDPISTMEFVTLIKKLRDEMGKTIILIEHKISEFEDIIDNVIQIENNFAMQIDKNKFLKELKKDSKLPRNKSKENKKSKDKILEVKNLSYSYEKNKSTLNNINFTLNKGEITGIIGCNGAGKSTLTKLLIGFNKPSKGEILLKDKNMQKLLPRQIGESMGLVFQNPEHQFIKMTVEKELSLSLEVRGVDKDSIAKSIKYYLEKFDLEKNKESNPFLLSQGQKRRLSTASMMINGQEILILDEPTYGQDRENLKELIEHLYKINNEGTSIIIITHDMELVASCCDNILYLENGEVKYDGSDCKEIENLFLGSRGVINE